ncbi:hypothetical protein E2C01_055972 [Portunus trituberculatus]|uniref:Uncharacterized protein n=1 Tax=Portunus trituberculatus TaxID=210409 RepID=A0A5B7GX01_PORTR|nr:hypothetical protein [Portunus trituberculatus]
MRVQLFRLHIGLNTTTITLLTAPSFSTHDLFRPASFLLHGYYRERWNNALKSGFPSSQTTIFEETHIENGGLMKTYIEHHIFQGGTTAGTSTLRSICALRSVLCRVASKDEDFLGSGDLVFRSCIHKSKKRVQELDKVSRLSKVLTKHIST